MSDAADASDRRDVSGASPVARRVAICGYYGFGNAGDELILAAILGEFRALRAGLAFTVISGDPASTAAGHGVDAVHWQDLPAIVELVRRADLVLVGGGGLFQEYAGIDPESLLSADHYSLTYYAEPAILGALLGRPVMLYAVGVGPLYSEHGRRIVRAACEAADVVTLRDEESLSLVASLGVDPARLRLTADPAWALPVPGAGAFPAALEAALPSGAGPLVGVALRPWAVGVSPWSREQEIASALDALVEARGARLLFVPFQEAGRAAEDDAAAAERVLGRMRHRARAAALPQGVAPGALGAVLARCDLVLGMRLHALVLAASAGVPAVALSYDPKVAAAMRQLGAGEHAVELADVEARTLSRSLVRALDGFGESRDGRRERVARLAALARENAVAALELLERGPGAGRPGAAVAEAVVRAVTSRHGVEASLRNELRAAAAAAEARERAFATELEARERERSAQSRAETAELEQALDDLSRQDVELVRARDLLVRREHELAEAREWLLRHAQETERVRGEAGRERERADRREEELRRIHASRLWRWADRYWRLLAALGRLKGSGGRPA